MRICRTPHRLVFIIADTMKKNSKIIKAHNSEHSSNINRDKIHCQANETTATTQSWFTSGNKIATFLSFEIYLEDNALILPDLSDDCQLHSDKLSLKPSHFVVMRCNWCWAIVDVKSFECAVSVPLWGHSIFFYTHDFRVNLMPKK